MHLVPVGGGALRLANPRSEPTIEHGQALLTGLRRLDDRAARAYLDAVVARLSPAARAALEAVMKSRELQSEFAKKSVTASSVRSPPT